MTGKYSPPPKLKCEDCSLVSTEVAYNKKHKSKLCVSCFVTREIKRLDDLKKQKG